MTPNDTSGVGHVNITVYLPLLVYMATRESKGKIVGILVVGDPGLDVSW